MRRSAIVAAIALLCTTARAEDDICSVSFLSDGETLEFDVQKLNGPAECQGLSSIQTFMEALKDDNNAWNTGARFLPVKLRWELQGISMTTRDEKTISAVLSKYVPNYLWHPQSRVGDSIVFLVMQLYLPKPLFGKRISEKDFKAILLHSKIEVKFEEYSLHAVFDLTRNTFQSTKEFVDEVFAEDFASYSLYASESGQFYEVDTWYWKTLVHTAMQLAPIRPKKPGESWKLNLISSEHNRERALKKMKEAVRKKREESASLSSRCSSLSQRPSK